MGSVSLTSMISLRPLTLFPSFYHSLPCLIFSFFFISNVWWADSVEAHLCFPHVCILQVMPAFLWYFPQCIKHWRIHEKAVSVKRNISHTHTETILREFSQRQAVFCWQHPTPAVFISCLQISLLALRFRLLILMTIINYLSLLLWLGCSLAAVLFGPQHGFDLNIHWTKI